GCHVGFNACGSRDFNHCLVRSFPNNSLCFRGKHSGSSLITCCNYFGSWLHGRIANGTWNKPLFVFSLILGILAIWKHRSNIQRLRAGTEPRFNRKGKANHA
ncbi:MAG: hypothetical protein HC767_01865, partial [Akkermansiaceae bacterium]|nr:hypothetical protein [Akkermansiaceae bacterium]